MEKATFKNNFGITRENCQNEKGNNKNYKNKNLTKNLLTSVKESRTQSFVSLFKNKVQKIEKLLQAYIDENITGMVKSFYKYVHFVSFFSAKEHILLFFFIFY